MTIDRRTVSRVACHLNATDRGGRGYRILDFTTEGMRIQGPSFSGALPLALEVGPRRLEFSAEKAWAREDLFGVTVSGDAATLSQLGYLAAALVHQAPENVRWLSFSLKPSADASQQEKRRISQIALPVLSRQAIAASAEIHRRDDFVWQWAYEAIRACTLNCVPPAELSRAIDIKLAYAVVMTALDDAADRLKDHELFQELRRAIPIFPEKRATPSVRLGQLAKLWSVLRRAIADLPNARWLIPWLAFDHDTILHAGTYSMVANQHPHGINRAELHNWNSQSFFIFAFANIDMMFIADPARERLGRAREIVHHAQNMCAIANWLGTWEREMREGDLSSGVAADAFERQVFTIDEMDEQPTASISLVRDAHVEEYWMAQWERHWHAIDSSPEPDLFDKKNYLSGLERAYALQMIGRGKL